MCVLLLSPRCLYPKLCGGNRDPSRRTLPALFTETTTNQYSSTGWYARDVEEVVISDKKLFIELFLTTISLTVFISAKQSQNVTYATES